MQAATCPRCGAKYYSSARETLRICARCEQPLDSPTRPERTTDTLPAPRISLVASQQATVTR